MKMVTPHPNHVDFLGMVDPWNLGLLKHRVSFFFWGGGKMNIREVHAKLRKMLMFTWLNSIQENSKTQDD